MMSRANKEEVSGLVNSILTKISAEELGFKLGKTTATLYNWKKGRNKVGLSDFRSLKIIWDNVKNK